MASQEGATICRPVYLVSGAGETHGSLAASIGIPAERIVASDALDRLRLFSPGLVLVPRAHGSEATLLAAADVLADKPGWQLAVLEGSDRLRMVTLSRTKPLSAIEAEGSGSSADGGDTMSSKLRHAINNHLTSALAETQLLLLDLEAGEVRTACETIQAQLEAISARVKATKRT